MQQQFDTRDIKKKSAPAHPSQKAGSIGGFGSSDRTIDDEKFVHQEINTAPGKVLERIRNECGISRKDLAQKLAIQEAQIASWENGKTQMPGPMKSRIENVLQKKLK
ncbi:Helix-turn-helix_domain-containing protein [Hexamita inflata]|uniref:Helix-turn-helix domain-containing protein n=1 Tax=Hexamita inflata TaxID=28002 RepID=A0AA86URW9_9EUKA|nr:Helix-turn-helix domain-containing protein [Hexamita inflata]